MKLTGRNDLPAQSLADFIVPKDWMCGRQKDAINLRARVNKVRIKPSAHLTEPISLLVVLRIDPNQGVQAGHLNDRFDLALDVLCCQPFYILLERLTALVHEVHHGGAPSSMTNEDDVASLRQPGSISS
jgi:hypothetical protein